MASEVALLASNHKLESNTERYFVRPQRPPPPPPTQAQPPSPRIEQPEITPERMRIFINQLSISYSFIFF